MSYDHGNLTGRSRPGVGHPSTISVKWMWGRGEYEHEERASRLGKMELTGNLTQSHYSKAMGLKPGFSKLRREWMDKNWRHSKREREKNEKGWPLGRVTGQQRSEELFCFRKREA